MRDSFSLRVNRLRDAVYPLLLGVAEALLRKVKGQGMKEKKRPQVILYLHKISHNLEESGKNI